MRRDVVRKSRGKIVRLAGDGLDWVTFATRATEVLSDVVPFDADCWHPVDPATQLFTGSLTRNVACSGSWLAQYEYAEQDVNKWSFLARSGYRAGSLNQATNGNLSLSARYRSSGGFADELRGSFVVDGTYWGAAGFIRAQGERPFEDDEIRFLASLSSPIAEAFRSALLLSSALTGSGSDDAPGLVVFDDRGGLESISPAAERWIEELEEVPAPSSPHESRLVQLVAARARWVGGRDEPAAGARSRVHTRTGRWLLLHGTRVSGGGEGRTAVIIEPAPSHEIAPLVLEAYGLSERERELAGMCLRGLSTKEIARALSISPYTVQDHLKTIFEKTGARSRAELVGRIFLDHCAPRWEPLQAASPERVAKGIPAGR